MKANTKKKSFKTRYAGFNGFMLAICIVMGILAITSVIMLFFALASSFKGLLDFERYPLRLFSTFKTENYAKVLQYMQIRTMINGVRSYIKIPEMYFNAATYSLGTSLCGTFVMCTTAYMCAKYKNWFSKVLVAIVVITMNIPIIGNTPAILKLMLNLGFYNRLWGMCIQKATFLGAYFLLFLATFESIPNDFGEAAQIDGASQLYVYLKIYFHLVRNMFLTMIIINFIGAWNDYQTPLLFLPDKPTISYGLFYLTQTPDNRFNGDTPMFLAAAAIVSLPTIILFAAFHKRLLGNLSMGGIKS